MSFSLNHSAAFADSKTAETTPLSAPVLTSSRLVLAPSTAPRESTTMDLPAPVSPVSTVSPLRNSISAFSITAIFSICSSVSISVPLYQIISSISWQKSSAALLLSIARNAVSSPARVPASVCICIESSVAHAAFAKPGSVFITIIFCATA